MNNNQRDGSLSYAGIPYEDINWYDISGQPLNASYFNAIVLEMPILWIQKELLQ